MKPERRFLTSKLEIRQADKEKRSIGGYAAKFNVLSEDFGGWREEIAPGAFDNVLNDDVRALFNHDSNMILGRTESDTLKLSIDKVGLDYTVDLPDTTVARDLAVSIQRGDIDQSSFAFIIARNGAEFEERQHPDDSDFTMVVRVITEIEQLFDVSPVTYAAYPDATVEGRAKQEFEDYVKQQITDDVIDYTREMRKRRLAILHEEFRSSLLSMTRVS